ncbi:MAG: GIY-YIG nuclease family protein [Arenimonas sp.]
MAEAAWILYLLECRRGDATVYYAGITNDLPRRLQAHRTGKGARFTRAHPPTAVVATRGYADRSSASKAEAALKKLPRARKPGFFTTG